MTIPGSSDFLLLEFSQISSWLMLCYVSWVRGQAWLYFISCPQQDLEVRQTRDNKSAFFPKLTFIWTKTFQLCHLFHMTARLRVSHWHHLCPNSEASYNYVNMWLFFLYLCASLHHSATTNDAIWCTDQHYCHWWCMFCVSLKLSLS